MGPQPSLDWASSYGSAGQSSEGCRDIARRAKSDSSSPIAAILPPSLSILAPNTPRRRWASSYGSAGQSSEGCRDKARRAKSDSPFVDHRDSSAHPRSPMHAQLRLHPPKRIAPRPLLHWLHRESRSQAQSPPASASQLRRGRQRRLLRLRPALPPLADQDRRDVHRSRSGACLRALSQIAIWTRVRQETPVIGLSTGRRATCRAGAGAAGGSAGLTFAIRIRPSR
jgi:hypothetical protein